MKPLALAMLTILMGCASGPQPSTYVLSAPADPVADVSREIGRPVVELRNVTLPDYLDTSDILVRDGRNELKSSQTGRWGERLSVGVTRALIVALAKRMPDVLVSRAALPGQAARDLLVDLEAFDVRRDGRCVLTAHWAVVGGDRRSVLSAERGSFVTQAAGLRDPAIVAAMAAGIEQLADRIAVTLGPGMGRHR